jgi:bacillolysin
MEKVYDYFESVFNRNSYNGTGGSLTSQIHNGLIAGKAVWLGGGVFSFGDGAGGFDILTCLDIMSHEMSHAINGAEINLATEGETGAINEGLGDIWGACVEHYTVATKETWQIAEDADFRLGENGIRSLSNPNSTALPDTYSGTNWVNLSSCIPSPGNDNCGVHTNCGVMGYWFYLLSEGGSGTNDNSHSFSVSGIGIEDAADIVYKAVTDYMTSSTLYANMRTYTIKAAQDLFGYCSPEVISVIDAWHAVGVGSSYATISNVTITWNIPASTTQDFYSPGTLTASNTIDGTSTNIRYRASEAVILEPGFEAKEGTNFVAEIIPCEDLSASKKEPSDNVPHQSDLSKESVSNVTSDIKVYPNPMDDYIQIVIGNEKMETGKFVITDLAGRNITEGELTGRVTQVSTQKLSSGTYMIKVDLNKNIFSYKLIKS